MRTNATPPDAPLAPSPLVLIEQQRGALRIVATCRRAAALGLGPGMMLADARGQVPELCVRPHDPAADLAVLERLAGLCRDFTPSVMPDPPQGLVLDIAGCTHRHGSEDGLVQALSARVAALGLTLRSALGDTPDAARALARFGGDSAAALPVQALEIAPELHTALLRAGLRTVGEVAALPRAALAVRFGSGLTALLDRLFARHDPRIVPQRSLAPLRAELLLPEPVNHSNQVLDLIAGLATEVAGQLAERHQGGRRFRVRLYRSDGHVARLEVETAAPTRDPALLLRLLRERIDSLADPLDPGFGYDRLDLAVTLAEALVESQSDLAPGAPRPVPRLAPLLDRLAVRHGGDAVLRLAFGNSHVPECAGLLKPLAAPDDGDSGESDWPAFPPDEPPLRPLLLFDPPQPVEVLAAVPDGPPRRFRWQGQ
ncbi:MAG TPA: DNA polymerase Y family protein, partial [Novosphingobium sp.]